MKRTGFIKDLIQIKSITDGFIIDESDSPAAVFEATGGINPMTTAGQGIGAAINSFKSAFNLLKPNEEVQIILDGRQFNPDTLVYKYNERVDKNHPVEEYSKFYPNMLDDFLTSFCHDNRVLDYKFYILFTYKEPEVIVKSLFNTKKKSVKRDVSEAVRDISLRSKAFVGALKQSGIAIKELNAAEIRDLAEKMLNPTAVSGIPAQTAENSFNELKSILARTPIAESHDKLMVGKEFVKTIYISDIPETSGIFQNLFGKNNYFTLSIFAKGISQTEMKSSLKKRLKLALGTGGEAADVENREIAQMSNDLLGLLARGEIKFVKFASYLSFRHEDLKKLEEISPDFQAVFQDAVMFEGLFEQRNLWLSTLPFCKNKADHYNITLTGSVPGITGGIEALFPFFNYETDNSEGGVLLGTSATGQPVLYNPWSKKLINGNHIIMGQPGSGKSFYVNLVLNRLSPWKPEVIIIDKSRSYEFLCKCNKGQYLMIGANSENSYNVFDALDYDPEIGEDNDINDKGEPTAAKIALITGLFDVILAEEGEKRLNKLDSSLVEKIIKATYKNKLKLNKDGKIDRATIPTLSDTIITIDKLAEDKENNEFRSELLKIKQKLGPFVGNGTYASLLDRQSNIELKSHFIVFDISNLPDRDDIQSLAVYIISNFAMQRFRINKKLGKRQILCIDEAWYLARFSGGRNFLLELAKRSRHLGLMVMIATQQIGDFLTQPEAAQVLKSAPTVTFFRQSSTDLDHLQEIFSLNTSEVGVLGSLTQERGRFSQAFYISGDNKYTLFVRPDPALRWIATSEPTYDVPARNKALEEVKGSPWDAVLKLLEQGA